jgi:hypothetical protein
MILIQYLMQTGITAANLGMEYTPLIEYSTIPTVQGNIDEVLSAAGVKLE